MTKAFGHTQRGRGSDPQTPLDQGRPPLATPPNPSLLLKKEIKGNVPPPTRPPLASHHPLSLAPRLAPHSPAAARATPGRGSSPQAPLAPPSPLCHPDRSLSRLARLAWVLAFGARYGHGSPLHSPGSPKVHTHALPGKRVLTLSVGQTRSHSDRWRTPALACSLSHGSHGSHGRRRTVRGSHRGRRCARHSDRSEFDDISARYRDTAIRLASHASNAGA